MRYVNASDMMQMAKKGGYAIPAINANGATYDIARAILEGANDLRSPIIIQAYEPNLEYRGYDYFVKLVKHLAEDIDVPVCISLDHGASINSIMKAVKAGFTHVMFDYAKHSIEENIALSNQVIDLVRPLGISVEGEIGDILTSKDNHLRAAVTPVDDITTYYSRTNVDLLAVGVGTTHGIFEKQDTIDFEHIESIGRICDVPLVLHGTCGVSMEDISKSVKCGMKKINFGEAIRMNYIRYFNEFSSGLNHEGHAWKIMQAAKDKLKVDIKEIIMAVGSDGKV